MPGTGDDVLGNVGLQFDQRLDMQLPARVAQIRSCGELLRDRRLAKAESAPAFSLRQLADRVGAGCSVEEQLSFKAIDIGKRRSVVAQFAKSDTAFPGRAAQAGKPVSHCTRAN